MAGNKRVPAEVQTAIEIARAANWDVSIRNDKLKIVAPDGVCITVGMSPNDESMKVFRSQARNYNLMGEGPARTPEQQQKLLEEVEKAGAAQADRQNQQRKAYEAEQAAKRKAAEEAAAKAAAATAKGMVSMPTDQAPTTTVSNATPTNGFPVFDPALLGTMDYPKFLLPNGRYYCIECWQTGEQFVAKKPQGLATHRGFRHQMYMGEGVLTSNQETSRVQLPQDVQDVFELLRQIVGEHVGTGDDSERVKELEAQVARLTEQSAEDLKKADQQYAEAKEAFDKALEAQKARVHELTKELTGKTGLHEAEVKAIMSNVQALLAKIREAVNGLSPAQAVGKIDELVSSYLGG